MKKMIIIGGIAAVVLIAVVLVVIFVVLPGGEDKEPEPTVYSEFPLGEQYTNIAEMDGVTSARKPVLKYSPVIQYPEDADVMAALTTNQTVIGHEFREYFMARNEEQLSRMDRVQEDLTEIVIEVTELDTEKISNVFFVEFIIQ